MYVYGDCDEGVSVVYMHTCTHVRVMFPVNRKQFIIMIQDLTRALFCKVINYAIVLFNNLL